MTEGEFKVLQRIRCEDVNSDDKSDTDTCNQGNCN